MRGISRGADDRDGGSLEINAMDYIAYLHKDRDSDFGVSFPDFPGCVTAGKTLDEAHRVQAEPETDRTVRINITASEKQVEEIDRLANQAGLTRSAYMVQSALHRYLRLGQGGGLKHAAKRKARRAAR